MIRYSRPCGSYQDFIDRGLLLTRKLLNQGFLWLSWSHHFESFSLATMTWLTVMECLCHKWPRICSTCHKHSPILFFPHSWLISGPVTRLTRRMPLVEQELLTLPEHLSYYAFSGVRVTRSLVLCACFVDRCLSFCPFSFGHCVVCPSIYGFWLPLWYLRPVANHWQTLSHNVVSSTHRLSGIRTRDFISYRHWSIVLPHNYSRPWQILPKV